MKDYSFPDGYSEPEEIDEDSSGSEANENKLESILKHGEKNYLCEEVIDTKALRKLSTIMLQFVDIETVIRIMEEVVDSEIITRFP